VAVFLATSLAVVEIADLALASIAGGSIRCRDGGRGGRWGGEMTTLLLPLLLPLPLPLLLVELLLGADDDAAEHDVSGREDEDELVAVLAH
jgi:hypothetical protein